MRKQYVPGPLLSFVGPGNEARHYFDRCIIPPNRGLNSYFGCLKLTVYSVSNALCLCLFCWRVSGGGLAERPGKTKITSCSEEMTNIIHVNDIP